MKRVRQQIQCDDDIQSKYSGKNISVAVLDTGIFLHPDFSDRIKAFKDFVNGKTSPYDDSGHGTHVAGCLGGSGSLSKGKLRGVAPECDFIICKVLNHKGEGKVEQMHEALSWILHNSKELNIKILNISVSFETESSPAKIRILTDMIGQITDQGIFTLVAAGNNGPAIRSISPLGLGNNVLCVGCHDLNYTADSKSGCGSYSGRGPSIFSIKKPDLVAPGTSVYSTSSRVRFTGKKFVSAYEARSGTSFATPIVAGTAALLLEKYPGLSREEIKHRICYSATDLKEPWNKQGWGMLNVRRALM